MLQGKHVFISYSRQQIYFAQSVALNLLQADIPVWMDTFELDPGEDWEAEINRGLDEAGLILVIGSQAAFASVYVNYEWERGLNSGIPIIVLLYEECQLPQALQSASRIDFRRNFQIALQRLIHSIRTGNQETDNILESTFFNLPFALPVDLRVLFVIFPLALAIPFATFIYLLLQKPLNTAISIFEAFFLLCFTWIIFQFIDILRNKYRFYASTLYLFPLLLFFTFYLSQPEYKIIQFFAFALALIHLAYFYYGIYRLKRPDVLHWSRFGGVTIATKQHILGDLYPTPPANLHLRSRLYKVHYADADVKIATQLHDAMEVHGHRIATEHGQSDLHILILSNQTPLDSLDTWLNEFDNPLILLASTIEISEEYLGIRKYQWVDFRTRIAGQMAGLARYLQNPRLQASYDINLDPRPPERLMFPVNIYIYANFLTGMNLLFFMLAFFEFVFVSSAIRAGDSIGIAWTLFFVTATIALLIWNFQVANRVLTREITFSNFNAYAGIALALLIILIIISSMSLLFKSAGLILGGILLVRFLQSRKELQQWLPNQDKAQDVRFPAIPRIASMMFRYQYASEILLFSGIFLTTIQFPMPVTTFFQVVFRAIFFLAFVLNCILLVVYILVAIRDFRIDSHLKRKLKATGTL